MTIDVPVAITAPAEQHEAPTTASLAAPALAVDTGAGHGVPWGTVVPLAFVMSFTNGFWLTAIRGAVGSIERTQGPFTSWLHDSTLMVPLYLLAVVAALVLARRRLGSSLRGARDVVSAGLFVAIGGTLAGAVVMATSAAYDYHLQVSQLAFMDSLHGACTTGVCLAQQEQATLAVQTRAVGYGVLILLVTNLVMVAWVTAARGGRLDVSAPARPGPDLLASRAGDLRLWLAAGLVGSAVIHAAVVPEHLDAWPAAGAFFVALVAAELVAAALVVAWPHLVVLLGTLLVSVGPLVLWAYSRVVGLPFGPDPGAREAVGLPDVAACALELGTLYLALVLLVASGRLARERAVEPALRAIGVLVLVVVTAFGLVGIGLPESAAGGDRDSASHSHAH